MWRFKFVLDFSLGLVIFLSFFISLTGNSADSGNNVPSTIYLNDDAENRLALDPVLRFSMSTHYLSVDGIAYAREEGVKSFTMSPLNIRSNMGVKDILIYDFELDWRVSLRNHLNVEYLFGKGSGSGHIGSPTGFNDHYWNETGETDGGIALNCLQVGWNYRALDLYGDLGRYGLDLGLGVMGIRSYISFAPEAKEEQLDTEQLFAPFMPYASIRSEWRPTPKVIFGFDGKLAGLEDFNPDLSALDLKPRPSAGIYYHATLYAQYPLNDYLSLTGGLDYYVTEVDFDGIEDDLDLASNELELRMLGAYLGVNFNDPHDILISAWRGLLR